MMGTHVLEGATQSCDQKPMNTPCPVHAPLLLQHVFFNRFLEFFRKIFNGSQLVTYILALNTCQVVQVRKFHVGIINSLE